MQLPRSLSVCITLLFRRRPYLLTLSLGRYSCPGQRLAIVILTHLVVLLVSKYDIEFAPGEDGSRVIDDMTDAFTLNPGQLDLIFKLRKEV